MSKPLPASPNDKESELGTLIVVLLKARNLNDKHSFRKSDVFAQATLNGAHKRTPVDIKGGQHPEWDGEVRFPVMKSTSAKFRTLEVACYSQEPRSEDLMGKGILDITQTLQTGEFDDWVPLEIDGVQRGDIYLEMTYYTNAPPPSHASAANKLLSVVQNQSIGLSRRPSKLSPAERLSRPPVSRPPDQSSNYVYGPYPPSSRLNEQHSLQKPVLNSGPNAVPASLIPTHAAESSQKGRPEFAAAWPGCSTNDTTARARAAKWFASLDVLRSQIYPAPTTE
ncbi:C2 domain-containing protein [Gymnopilus junonius]|uniref:C2 domain-containing protein n=1 Tax=Gymnopilus junonius TaxID=109634 RepID=A0A9P5TN22_GYMJU|nr:C2 domain-containing protein [Gymnopilus junonius]